MGHHHSKAKDLNLLAECTRCFSMKFPSNLHTVSTSELNYQRKKFLKRFPDGKMNKEGYVKEMVRIKGGRNFSEFSDYKGDGSFWERIFQSFDLNGDGIVDCKVIFFNN
jgi:hypothetical protein